MVLDCRVFKLEITAPKFGFLSQYVYFILSASHWYAHISFCSVRKSCKCFMHFFDGFGFRFGPVFFPVDVVFYWELLFILWLQLYGCSYICLPCSCFSWFFHLIFAFIILNFWLWCIFSFAVHPGLQLSSPNTIYLIQEFKSTFPSNF